MSDETQNAETGTETQAETNVAETTAPAKPKKTEAEVKAAANAAAQKHRANVKNKGLVALQQWVPGSRRDLLREWLKLATAKHAAGDEAFFEALAAQLPKEEPASTDGAITESNA